MRKYSINKFNVSCSILKNLCVTHNAAFLDTTDSTSVGSGSVVIYGGMGIAKTLNITGNVNIASNINITGILNTATASKIGNLTLSDGSITDSSGDITFDDVNLVTTGTFGSGVATLATGTMIGNLTFANGSITDTSGTITFDNDNLITTGFITISSNSNNYSTLTNNGDFYRKYNSTLGGGLSLGINSIVPINYLGVLSTQVIEMGIGSYEWKNIYLLNSPIVSSDREMKSEIIDLDIAEKTVAKNIKQKIKKFKWNRAIKDKGDKARFHIGIIAQELEEVFLQEGLDATNYGILCKTEIYYDTDGNTCDENNNTYTENSANCYMKMKYSIRSDELMYFIISSL
jgi:hypothetical protein